VRVRCLIGLKTTPNPVRLSSRRSLKGLKSGFRGDSYLIKSDFEDKSIINVTHLRKASVGDESNYKSPSADGDLGVVEEEYDLIHPFNCYNRGSDKERENGFPNPF
jgi:hypothetical protein